MCGTVSLDMLSWIAIRTEMGLGQLNCVPLTNSAISSLDPVK